MNSIVITLIHQNKINLLLYAYAQQGSYDYGN